MKILFTLFSMLCFCSLLSAEEIQNKKAPTTPHPTKVSKNESGEPKASLNTLKEENTNSELKHKIMTQYRHGRTAMARERLGEN